MQDNLETSPKVCTNCDNQLPISTYNYCPSCGALSKPSSHLSHFDSFRSRWFGLIIVLSFIPALLLPDSRLLDFVPSLAMAFWITFVVGRGNISLRSLIGEFPKAYNWWPILLMTVAGLIYSIGSSTVLTYPIAKYLPELYQDIFLIPFSQSLIGSFILVVILAPLIEEIVFRGLIFTRLTKKWGMIRGMITSSLIFGLLHFPLDPIGAFTFGVVACVLYVRTKTLVVPITLHALHNFIIWLIMSLGYSGPSQAPSDSGEIAFTGLIAMLIASPIVFILLGRWWPHPNMQLPYDANETTRLS